jgi:diguanylate cyclase
MLTPIVMTLIGFAIGFGVAWRIGRSRSLQLFIAEARTDILTGLKNRRAFNEDVSRLFAQRQRQGIYFSVIMLDVDQFKKLNDLHGHLSGDVVLQSVGEVLSTTLREMDIVCRFGGDEFAVICPGSKLQEAAIAAERARQAVAKKSIPLKHSIVQVTVSLGVAEVATAEIAESLIQRADEALYAAKQAGRNRVHLHNGQAGVSAATN